MPARRVEGYATVAPLSLRLVKGRVGRANQRGDIRDSRPWRDRDADADRDAQGEVILRKDLARDRQPQALRERDRLERVSVAAEDRELFSAKAREHILAPDRRRPGDERPRAGRHRRSDGRARR